MSRIAAVTVPQDTAFAGTTESTHRTRPGVPPRLLRGVSVDSMATYDRIVFEFADTVPGYHVEYATRPVVRCGSGDPVTVAGTARLVVRLQPARAHDDRGNSSVERRAWSPGLPAVKEMTLICDFEGQVEWVLGVGATRPYRVTETDEPPRVILDVRRGP
ncbi:MAG: AMIN-like domain-containing (lipo)protein [Gemmatimonadales bacterium]